MVLPSATPRVDPRVVSQTLEDIGDAPAAAADPRDLFDAVSEADNAANLSNNSIVNESNNEGYDGVDSNPSADDSPVDICKTMELFDAAYDASNGDAMAISPSRNTE